MCVNTVTVSLNVMFNDIQWSHANWNLLTGVWAEQEENLHIFKVAQKSGSFHKRWQLIVLVTPFRQHSGAQEKEGWKQDDRGRVRERAEGGVTSSIPLRSRGHASSTKSHQCYIFCIPSGSDTRNHRNHRCPELIYSSAAQTQSLRGVSALKHTVHPIYRHFTKYLLSCLPKVWKNTLSYLDFLV